MNLIGVFQNLQFIGLLYDAVGILVLGIPLATKGLDTMLKEAGTYWDSNIPVARSLILQRMDSGVGTVLLGIGFLLQASAQIVHQAPPGVGMPLLTVLILAIPTYYGVVRRKLLKRQLKVVQAKLQEKG